MNQFFSKKQELFIRRAFDLARLAEGSAVPNPMVGAVIVFKDRIIGEGFFKGFGMPHAEVNAVNNIKTDDRKYLTQSEIYVSLEPCNFFGKTPACTSLILKSKIPKVIISSIDKTPQVSGNGIDLLRQNGVEVLTGILEKKGNELVKYRTNYVERNTPFVILEHDSNLNLGGFLFVKRMGTNAIENKIEIKINGSYFIGLLTFSKTLPKANAK